MLSGGVAKIFYGSFSLPNDYGCVSIGYKEQILDSFCYEKRKEWTIFRYGNTTLEEVNSQDLSILKKIGFIQKGNQRCINYENTLLKCRNIPRAKTDLFLKIENGMYRQAFKLFEQTIRQKYTPLYYQSELKELFDLVKAGKQDLKNKITSTWINNTTLLWSEFDTIYQKQQDNQLRKWVIQLFESLMN